MSAAALALCLYHTGSIPLIDRDEGRYAEAAREMLESGDWVVPRLFGVPYLEKPPLLYWLTAVSCWFLGLNELGARLVSGLAAAGGVMATGLFTRRIFGDRAGLLASLILATSGLYVVLSRVIITDTLFSVLIAAALMAYFVAETERRSFLVFWLLAAAATLVKGPVAMALCALPVLGHQSVQGTWRLLLTRRFWLGFPVFLALVLPWFWLIERRFPGFLHFYVYKEHILRAVGDEHRHGFLWYVPWLLLGFLPWTPTLAATATAIARRTREQTTAGAAARFAVTWATIVFVFFSVPRGKLAPYVLPILPALSIVLGDAIDRWIDGPDDARATSWSFCLIAALLSLAVVGLPVAATLSPIEIPRTVVAVTVVLAAVAAAVAWLGCGTRGLQAAVAVAVAMAILECAAAIAAVPVARALTVKPIVEVVRERLGPDDGLAIYGGYFPIVPFYLQRMPVYVFGNRELDFGISLEGRGQWIVPDLPTLQQRVGERTLFVVLRTRVRDLRDLMKMPGETRILYRGRSSLLIENHPPARARG